MPDRISMFLKHAKTLRKMISIGFFESEFPIQTPGTYTRLLFARWIKLGNAHNSIEVLHSYIQGGAAVSLRSGGHKSMRTLP